MQTPHTVSAVRLGLSPSVWTLFRVQPAHTQQSMLTPHTVLTVKPGLSPQDMPGDNYCKPSRSIAAVPLVNCVAVVEH